MVLSRWHVLTDCARFFRGCHCAGNVDFAIVSTIGGSRRVCSVELKNLKDFSTPVELQSKWIGQVLAQADAGMPRGVGQWTYAVLTTVRFWILVYVSRSEDLQVHVA